MARLPRLALAGHAHHLVQQGGNNQSIFTAPADYQMMWALLRENAQKFGVSLHAYALLTSQFHVLATPATSDGLPQMMQSIGRRYVRYFNDLYGRSGTLWTGRYKGGLIEADTYLLACMVHIDRSPVRLGLAHEAGGYRWSSYAHHAGLRTDALLTPHSRYWALGNTPFAREAAYVEMVHQGTSLDLSEALDRSVMGSWPLGSPLFLAELQKVTTRRLAKNKSGRPLAQRLA